ncbi:barrier-to-autointegration factor [Elysia marginata]|uniref:Barrier-to-autointegration factor-like protein n=1 Tax=Elysia marginata TaxID=1093978 RepID=A0AAV4HFU3_9GAST|nr:barrier-to-autointegration factor [Elysia marginata]
MFSNRVAVINNTQMDGAMETSITNEGQKTNTNELNDGRQTQITACMSIRSSLSPIIIWLRIFGLYFENCSSRTVNEEVQSKTISLEDTLQLEEWAQRAEITKHAVNHASSQARKSPKFNKVRHIFSTIFSWFRFKLGSVTGAQLLHRLYCVMVSLLLVANFVKSLLLLVGESGFGMSYRVVMVIWYSNTTLGAFVLLYSCTRDSHFRLFFKQWVELYSDPKTIELGFSPTSCRKWVLVVTVGSVVSLLLNVVMVAVFVLLEEIPMSVKRSDGQIPACLPNLRMCHLRMCKLLDTLNHYFRLYLAVSMTFSVAAGTFILYQIVAVKSDHWVVIGNVWWFLGNVLVILSTSVTLSMLHEAAHSPLEELFSIHAVQVDTTQAMQLELFGFVFFKLNYHLSDISMFPLSIASVVPSQADRHKHRGHSTGPGCCYQRSVADVAAAVAVEVVVVVVKEVVVVVVIVVVVVVVVVGGGGGGEGVEVHVLVIAVVLVAEIIISDTCSSRSSSSRTRLIGKFWEKASFLDFPGLYKSTMSSTSKKHTNFIQEPMGEKLVTELAGIGDTLGKRLTDANYDKAYVVLGQFLLFKKDEDLFKEWLKDACGANSKQSGDCYHCIKEWCDSFL